MADSWLARCRPFLAGSGQIESIPDGARLILPSASASRYSDAQLDDYAGLTRRRFPHRPPLHLALHARFSHGAHQTLTGTAGFGFWNNPFGPQSKIPALPQALWFFYAGPSSNLSLALDVPGHGWKAACIDAGRRSALAWAPLAPLVTLISRSPKLYRGVWPRVQRALGISEKSIVFRQGDMTGWHTYEVDWQRDGACWQVDGETILETDRAPRGPLGFVAWIDNQYAVVTPQGKLRFGLLDAPFEQWIELKDLRGL
ncbi:MAG TPA: family 16 glycosylhydrolase [Anaerolineae bacterium]|nr:family 16 glycosylhydrolase [Anaerolineae bacterium]